jgi:uncharacterized protein involved in response to NO
MPVEPHAAPGRLAAPLWASPFRPFFLLGPLYGVLVMALTVAALLGHWQPRWPLPLWVWHGHEMMFGFAAAIVSGFVLTALPSWAGTPEVPRWQLALLVATWLAGRAAFWLFPDLDSAWLLFDAGYFLLSAAVLIPGLRAARHRAAFALLPIVLAFAVANALFYVRLHGDDDTALRWTLTLSVDALLVLFAIVAGFLAPEFTRVTLLARGDPHPVTFDRRVEAAALASLLLYVALDLAPAGAGWSGAAAAFACAAHGVRLARWRSRAILDTPVLWVMHLGYAWLVIAFGLWALEDLAGWHAAGSPALHAFTVGGYGLVKLGVMSRVALKHTGREIEPGALMVAAYLLMALAALLRVAAPGLPMAHAMLVFSGGLWAACMAVYLGRFGACLIGPSLPTRGVGRL